MWNMFGKGFCWISRAGDESFKSNFQWDKNFKCLPLGVGNLYITKTPWPANRITIG